VSNKVYIVIQGEVEIVKADLSSVFYNHETGVVGIKEFNAKETMLRSDFELPDNSGEEVTGLLSSKCKYTGSEFHMSIQ